MRLDKYLADCGIGTRSEIKKIIRSGRICVNGFPVKEAKQQVSKEGDMVTCDGEPIAYNKYRYYMLNKPAGCVTALTDDRFPTVMKYLADADIRDCAPVGRLDLDTEGLLIITNDGPLTHHLISPSHHVPKTYYAELDRPCPEAAAEAFREGVDIGDDKSTLPAELELSGDGMSARLTIYEGRYHQVKRMFESVGCSVTYLKRERFAELELGDLAVGQYRKLSEDEIYGLKHPEEACP